VRIPPGLLSFGHFFGTRQYKLAPGFPRVFVPSISRVSESDLATWWPRVECVPSLPSPAGEFWLGAL
jgi:hypothetical protein